MPQSNNNSFSLHEDEGCTFVQPSLLPSFKQHYVFIIQEETGPD